MARRKLNLTPIHKLRIQYVRLVHIINRPEYSDISDLSIRQSLDSYRERYPLVKTDLGIACQMCSLDVFEQTILEKKYVSMIIQLETFIQEMNAFINVDYNISRG